jgi:diguanylate cyclase (GGDEF)-like protein
LALLSGAGRAVSGTDARRGRRFHALPLAIQLLLGMAIVTTLVSLTAGLVVRSVERSYLTALLTAESEKKLDLLVIATIDDVISEDIPRLQTTMNEAMRRDPTFASARVTNASGGVLYAWQRDAPATPAKLLSSTREVRLKGELFGVFSAAWTIAGMEHEINRHSITIAGGVGAVCLLLSLFVYLLIRALAVAPINRITERLADFHRGVLDRPAALSGFVPRELRHLDEAANMLGEMLTLRAQRDSEHHAAKALEVRLSASKLEITELQENLEVVRTESLTDPLTSLANRKFFDDALATTIAAAHARHEPLSLLLMDIDHFKKFNDSYGHVTGDQVLRLAAIAVKQNVKGRDIAARYGGEEFAVILPDTALRSAITLADHIRRVVMNKKLMKRSTGQDLRRMTISIGVATLGQIDSPQSLIERADVCLYAAKRCGRNRVIGEADPEANQAAPKVA